MFDSTNAGMAYWIRDRDVRWWPLRRLGRFTPVQLKPRSVSRPRFPCPNLKAWPMHRQALGAVARNFDLVQHISAGDRATTAVTALILAIAGVDLLGLCTARQRSPGKPRPNICKQFSVAWNRHHRFLLTDETQRNATTRLLNK